MSKKKINTICFFLIFLFIGMNKIYSQVGLIGDTVDVGINGYKGGVVQWQFSNDKKKWNYIEAANKQNEKIKICLNGYARAKISNCNQINLSDSLFFHVNEKVYSIGVFGGSVCSIPESEFAKSIWLDSLGRSSFKIETKGTGGSGFSCLTGNSVPTQIRNAKAYDIYVLWASTNDLYHSAPKGDVTSQDTISQCGGINYALRLIAKKNKKALVLFFTSLPVFFKDDNFAPYVESQVTFCKAKKIIFLDQFALCGISYLNKWQSIFYKSDLLHPTIEGYKYVGPLQANFLKTEIYKYLIYKIE